MAETGTLHDAFLEELRDTYDANGDGVFETVIVTPPRAAAVSTQQFDPALHQPLRDRLGLVGADLE